MSNRAIAAALQDLDRCLALLEACGATVAFININRGHAKPLVMLDQLGALPAELDRLRLRYPWLEGVHLPEVCGCLLAWEKPEAPAPGNVFRMPRTELTLPTPPHGDCA